MSDDDITIEVPKKSKIKLESKTLSMKDVNEPANGNGVEAKPNNNKDAGKISENVGNRDSGEIVSEEKKESIEIKEGEKAVEDLKKETVVVEVKPEEKKDDKKEEKKEEKKDDKKDDKKEEKKEDNKKLVEKKQEKKDEKKPVEKKDDKKDAKKDDKRKGKKEEKKPQVKNDKNQKKNKKDDKKAPKKDLSSEVIVLTDIEVLVEEIPDKDNEEGRENISNSEDNNDNGISLVVTEVEESDKPKKGFSLLKKLKNMKVAKQEQKRAATRIQAIWRGYAFRKKLDKAGKIPILLKQATTLRQLIAIESTYLSHLYTICFSYLHPLREFNKFNEESRKAFPMSVVNTIFRNIEPIYMIHKQFLADLEKRIDLWPFCPDIPSILLRVCGNFSIYLRYAEEAAVADETLRNYKDVPPLSTFLTTMYNDRKQNIKGPVLDLPSLLVLPYKHLSKIWNACAMLFHCSPPTMQDFDLLADSVGILSQQKKLIWNVAEEAINKRKMTILSTRIQSSRLVSIPKESKPRIIDLQSNNNNNSANSSPTPTPANLNVPSTAAEKRKSSKKQKKEDEKKKEKEKENKDKKKKGGKKEDILDSPSRRGSSKKSSNEKLDNKIKNEAEKNEKDKPEVVEKNDKNEKNEKENNNNNNSNNNSEDNNSESGQSKDVTVEIKVEEIPETTEKPEILLGQDVEERTFELYAPHRKLVKNGSLMVNSKKRHIFLFNDVCVILQVVSSLTSKFEAFFELKEAKISAKSVSLETSTQKFMIKSTNGSFVFVEKLVEGETSWMQTFEELIQYTTDKLFGSSLETITNRERTAIPNIILNIIQALHKNITYPWLFQTQYNPKIVQALRDPAAHRKLHNANPHDVIGLLIMYLEQLPDLIISFDSKDPIFSAQGKPTEEKLVQWVRTKVESMSIHEKNLLEYIMSFLSKVLSKSSSNRVHSLSLGVTFGPLIIKPKELTLEYCFKMPRLIRIVETIILRAGELFKTADDISNPLPVSVEEFLLSDQFSQPWWRDFGQKKPYFIQYICKAENINQLVNYILDVSDNEDTDINKRRSQFATSSYGILVNDGVIHQMLEEHSLLDLVVVQFKGQQISERANKFFCDFIEIILRGNTDSFAEYLDSHPDMNERLIHSIGSGNFCNMILSIAEAWQSKPAFHRIVVSWGVAVLKLVLVASDTCDSDQLANSIRFLRFLIRTNSFMSSPLSTTFVELLDSKDYLNGLLDRSLNSDIDTCVCCIPLVIEILVHSKSKFQVSRTNSSDDSSQNHNNNNNNSNFDNTPIIALAIGERHDKLVSCLRANIDVKPLPPLGFFRFGIVKLIQALLITNYPYCNMIISTTDLIGACLDLFFVYYQHSILHSVIAYIIRYIMAIGNSELINLLIVKYRIPYKLIDIFELKEHSNVLVNLRGYLVMIALSIRKSSVAEELLRNDPRWENFVEVLIREEKAQSESAMSAKRYLSRGKVEFISDQLEDKIG